MPEQDRPGPPPQGHSPIPLLMTVRELNFGGIERDITNIALHLDRRYFQVHVASYFPYGARYDELRANGIPVVGLPIGRFLSRATVEAALVLRRYIQARQIRILHAWDNSSVLAVPLARLCKVPVVVSSVLGHRSLTRRSTVHLLRHVDRMSDAVVTNCHALLRHLAEDEGVPRHKLHICRNGIDTQKFSPGTRDIPELRDASLVVGTVAVLRPVKAIEVLLEAFAQMQGCHQGMKLVVVGDGPELPRLEAARDHLGLEKSCLFVPGTEDVVRWLRAMDIFILCSLSEGFSNTLLEAMACGCATIATRVGGTPELLGQNERGLLCRSGDPDDLANRLRLLVTDPPLRTTLGDRAMRFAQEMSIERATSSFSDLYTSLLDRHKSFVR